MMDELKPQTKTGLVNLIFGIYENDVKEVLGALEQVIYPSIPSSSPTQAHHNRLNTTDSPTPYHKVLFHSFIYRSLTHTHCIPLPIEQIEVLRKGVDKFSVEKIARFFLKEFSTGVSKDGKWSSSLPPEEQKRIKLERRKQLGADLFSVGSDVPFKFPPTFTFVFRAFTSLDGIGKGLDPTYDLTRLAQVHDKCLLLISLISIMIHHPSQQTYGPHCLHIIASSISVLYSSSLSHTSSLAHIHPLPL